MYKWNLIVKWCIIIFLPSSWSSRRRTLRCAARQFCKTINISKQQNYKYCCYFAKKILFSCILFSVFLDKITFKVVSTSFFVQFLSIGECLAIRKAYKVHYWSSEFVIQIVFYISNIVFKAWNTTDFKFPHNIRTVLRILSLKITKAYAWIPSI